MTKKLNGDVKVIVNEIGNLKEHVNDKFIELNKNDEKIFTVLETYNTKITRNDTYLKVGAVIMTIIITLIINILIGG